MRYDTYIYIYVIRRLKVKCAVCFLEYAFDLMITLMTCFHDEWVPVTTAWRFFSLWMKERPPIWRVAANILNKQSRTADKGWSSSLGVGGC